MGVRREWLSHYYVARIYVVNNNERGNLNSTRVVN